MGGLAGIKPDPEQLSKNLGVPLGRIGAGLSPFDFSNCSTALVLESDFLIDSSVARPLHS
jgi:hypothetical protein